MDDILQSLGLSLNEARLYRELVRSGECGVSEIARRCSIHRRNVYDALQRLIERGLVFQVLSSKENLYQGVHPDKLNELLAEKQKELNSILPQLTKEFEDTPHQEEVFIYKGIQGFKNYLRDVLRVGEDLYTIGAKGYWFDPALFNFSKDFLKELKKKKIKVHNIFEHSIKENHPDILKHFNKPHVFFPKSYSTQMSINVFGDRVVSFTGIDSGDLGKDVCLTVVVNKDLAEGYRNLFQLLSDSVAE